MHIEHSLNDISAAVVLIQKFSFSMKQNFSNCDLYSLPEYTASLYLSCHYSIVSLYKGKILQTSNLLWCIADKFTTRKLLYLLSMLQDMIENVLEIKDTHVREVMTPLIDVLAIDAGATLLDFHKFWVTHPYSRYVNFIRLHLTHFLSFH